MNSAGKWSKIIQIQEDSDHMFSLSVVPGSDAGIEPGLTAETRKVKRDNCWGGVKAGTREGEYQGTLLKVQRVKVGGENSN